MTSTWVHVAIGFPFCNAGLKRHFSAQATAESSNALLPLESTTSTSATEPSVVTSTLTLTFPPVLSFSASADQRQFDEIAGGAGFSLVCVLGAFTVADAASQSIAMDQITCRDARYFWSAQSSAISPCRRMRRLAKAIPTARAGFRRPTARQSPSGPDGSRAHSCKGRSGSHRAPAPSTSRRRAGRPG